MSTIKFGTDGWRAIIAKDYTVENVARISYATAQWVKNNFDNPSMSRFSINDLQMIVKDLGIINKTNLMLDINNASPINELFLESINASGYSIEDLQSENSVDRNN